MSTPEPYIGPIRSWAVIEKVRVRGKVRAIPRLQVVAVPERASRKTVVEALEAAGCAAQFSAAGEAWANHVVVPEDRWPTFDGSSRRVEVWDWPSLLKARERRTLFLDLPPALHARLRLAANRAGQSMRGWATERLTEAVEAADA